MKRFSYLMLFFALPLIAEWQSSSPHEEALEFQNPQQGWVRCFEGSRSHCIREINDGYIVLSYDCRLIKLNKNGDMVWEKKYNNDRAKSVYLTSDGGYIITGSYEHFYVWLLKTDSNGDSIWAYTYGDRFLSNRGNSVLEAVNGGYVFTGVRWVESISDESKQLFIWKVDSLGNTIWTRDYGHVSQWSQYDEGNSISETTDGGFIITGRTSNNDFDLWLLKTDSQGYIEWEEIYTRSDVQDGNCVQETSDGGYIITGRTHLYDDDYGDLWLIKTNSSGDIIWERIFGEIRFGGDEGHWVKETQDSGYIVTGEAGHFTGKSSEVWLIKTDSQGSISWEKTYGGSGYDRGYCVQITSDDGYIISGMNGSFIPAGVFVIKTDSMGEIPIQVSSTRNLAPTFDGDYLNMFPKAEFTNFGTKESAENFYCHCMIVDLDNSSYLYHDSALITEPLNPWESLEIEFAEWTAPQISDFEATFFTTEAGNDQPLVVNFRWTGIEEEPSAHQPPFEVLTSVGNQIVLRFAEASGPQPGSVAVFDATGRLVDKIRVPAQGGTVTWPVTPIEFSPGVYFFREAEGSQTQKAVLIK